MKTDYMHVISYASFGKISRFLKALSQYIYKVSPKRNLSPDILHLVAYHSTIIWSQGSTMLTSLPNFPGYAREQRICLQPSPSRVCRKKRLKKGKGFFAWPQGKEPDCNSLRYYTRSLNFQQPPPPPCTIIKRFIIVRFSPGMHGNNEYAYSPVLPGHVVKSDGRRGRGSLLGPEAKNRTAIVFDTTRGP